MTKRLEAARFYSELALASAAPIFVGTQGTDLISRSAGFYLLVLLLLTVTLTAAASFIAAHYWIVQFPTRLDRRPTAPRSN